MKLRTLLLWFVVPVVAGGLICARIFAWTDAVSIMSLGVTLLGFTLALIQINTSTTAVDAARRAVERTEQRLVGTQLMVMIPELERAEALLDKAIGGTSVSDVLASIVQCRRLSGELHGLVSGRDDVDDSVKDVLRKTGRAATSAKRKVARPNVTFADATEPLRGLLSEACQELARITGEMRSTGE